MSKIRETIIRLIFGNNFKSNNNEVGVDKVYNEMNQAYMFDFKGYASDFEGAGTPDDSDSFGSSSESTTIGKYSTKIKIKPKDVLCELETVPTPFSLNMIDEKLAVLKDKEKLISQHYAKRELNGIIERLTLRKKYPEFKTFFDNYQNTTDEKIDNLLSKYELVMKSADIFIPEFPDDAVEVMKQYTEKMDELCGKKPVFYVIAEEYKFRKAYEKRDPILLVQSPFGFYWQILGAWDEEMLILHEL